MCPASWPNGHDPPTVTDLLTCRCEHAYLLVAGREPETKASVRRSEDWLSPGTIMQKRLCIMLCSSALCQSVAVPPPCASSLLHFSACDLGSPASRQDMSHTRASC